MLVILGFIKNPNERRSRELPVFWCEEGSKILWGKEELGSSLGREAALKLFLKKVTKEGLEFVERK